ncbi:hypothetical protein [Crassaminicella profunda]|uniref:hypothetical protein n=1 Tax=Crassaminicella profunda TaxID=1286698 RepID=UPI001CA68873|nr:hypothetical protein [Crassaminicella profunda]QZY53690.1 hypothetical protein K7H06_11525 [Crassaminicella profunda]
MEIKDEKGKYRLKVDTRKNIVYETQIGYWKPEDLERFHKDYVTKIRPLFKDETWSKCCDLRNYKTSMITVKLQKHNKWAVENGLTKAAILLEDGNIYNSVIGVQMNAAGKDISVKPKIFTSNEEAYKWLQIK